MTIPSTDAVPMRCSSTIAALVTALAKAQGMFPDIAKDKTARIQTRAGNTFSYSYADLAAILAAVRKPLAENELAVLQPVHVNGNRVEVITLVAHASGEFVSAELQLPIGDPTDARSLASSITYARRYGLISLLGIAPSDEDDDAEAAVAHKGSAPKKGPPLPADPPPKEPLTTASPPPTAAAYISDKQVRRLFAIARDGGWSEQDVKVWLITQGIGSPTKIIVDEYDSVVSMLQRAAP